MPATRRYRATEGNRLEGSIALGLLGEGWFGGDTPFSRKPEQSAPWPSDPGPTFLSYHGTRKLHPETRRFLFWFKGAALCLRVSVVKLAPFPAARRAGRCTRIARPLRFSVWRPHGPCHHLKTSAFIRVHPRLNLLSVPPRAPPWKRPEARGGFSGCMTVWIACAPVRQNPYNSAV